MNYTNFSANILTLLFIFHYSNALYNNDYQFVNEVAAKQEQSCLIGHLTSNNKLKQIRAQ
jgi:hypothetical protein